MTANTEETRYVTRAIEMPILFPRDKAEQKALGDLINRTLQCSARVANIAQGALYQADMEALRDQPPAFGKLHKIPKVNIYQIAIASEAGQLMLKGSVSALCRYVRRKWTGKWTGKNATGRIVRRTVRHAAMTGDASVPQYRSVPFPVRAQETWMSKAHRPHLGRGGEPFIWLPLIGEEGWKWVEVQLKMRAKRGFRRQYETFVRMVNGELPGQQIEIYRKRGTHSRVVMAKLIVTRPVGGDSRASGDLLVRTRADALLVASKRGRPRDWWYNARHIRELIAGKRDRDQRLREDAKAETRRPPGSGRGPMARMGRESIKHQKRVNDFLHRTAKEVLAFAKRQRAARLVYDDSVRDYLPRFAYHQLAELIKQKAQAAGVTFTTFAQAKEAAGKAKAADALARLVADHESLLQERHDDSDADAE